ncbi:hypothetical protein AVEN_270669-1 [Araneus ventricosus]|uniref:Uncharacterized protein n=1 Tax=Araneus ventricosus TaxID=182803 RepID=A0A4Y2PC32_ARAVE|nr:hypothetical protein AVEN_270669-1 [Araneus ventricosus]
MSAILCGIQNIEEHSRGAFSLFFDWSSGVQRGREAFLLGEVQRQPDGLLPGQLPEGGVVAVLGPAAHQSSSAESGRPFQPALRLLPAGGGRPRAPAPLPVDEPVPVAGDAPHPLGDLLRILRLPLSDVGGHAGQRHAQGTRVSTEHLIHSLTQHEQNKLNNTTKVNIILKEFELALYCQKAHQIQRRTFKVLELAFYLQQAHQS